MRRMVFSAAVLAAGLASVAFAQGYGGYRGDPYNRGERYRQGDTRREGYGGPGIVNRVRGDLERTAASSAYAHRQRGHFDHALKELNRFDDRLRLGKFDKGALGEVIGEMSHLSRARELDPRARDLMARDSSELRAFRDNRGYEGYGRRW